VLCIDVYLLRALQLLLKPNKYAYYILFKLYCLSLYCNNAAYLKACHPIYLVFFTFALLEDTKDT